MSKLAELTLSIKSSLELAHKRDIAEVMKLLPNFAAWHSGAAIAIGDDCAAIPDGNGFLLLATEGFLNDFVATQPWFAGYCGVMVNVSDIYAMGNVCLV